MGLPACQLARRSWKARRSCVFIDSHADFQHLGDEPAGEVASLDLALAMGRGPEALTDLDRLRPLVRDEDRPAHADVATRIGMTIGGIVGTHDDGPGFSRAMAAERS